MIQENIKRFRLDKDWTQEDLAEKLNVTRQTISKWEQGINEPDISTLRKLSDIFEISIDELIGKEEEYKEDKFQYIRKILNVVSISLCIFLSLMLIIFTRYLYNKIPMHYNGEGKIDRWGSKWEWLFMILGFISVLGADLFCCHLITKGTNSKMEKAAVLTVKICCWICQIVFIGIFFGFAV
ncbi:MAG: helix-turn-helix domain-containing protein, partial [Anaeroplasmataceae bacterium]|nr:helix-turn-helix domain-containing protein [Anaeroplasmataceae bacterium]